jgi:acyl phosphate:glycerol-3-phosphate acyltransferase
MLGFILMLIGAYLIGSIPTAFIIVKWRYKSDIRQYGSGSVGASNVYRNFSKRFGILVFFWDVAKGVLVIGVAQMLHMDLVFQIATGLAVVIGHNWPVFLKFNAGRGIATTLGVSFMLMPWLVVIYVIGGIIIFVIGNAALLTLIGIAAFPVVSYLRHEPLLITLGLLALFIVMVFRRLTPPLTERSQSIKLRELILNRFLFDRDVRDGKAWISFKPIGINKSRESGEIK